MGTIPAILPPVKGKAKKLPLEIDFFDLRFDIFVLLPQWVKSFGDKFEDHFELETENGPTLLYVKTIDGSKCFVNGDFMICRGIAGEYYPCKKDIFEKTYQIIKE